MTERLRPATVDDAPAIGELVLGLAGSFICELEAAVAFLETLEPAFLAEEIGSGRIPRWLAENDGRLLGVVGIRDRCHLFHLFVAAGAQGRGLGRRLLERAIAEMVEPGLEVLTVSASINALGFYLDQGFVATGPEIRRDGLAWIPMALILRE